MRKYIHKPLKIIDLVENKIYIFPTATAAGDYLHVSDSLISKAKKEKALLCCRYSVGEADILEYIEYLKSFEADYETGGH